MQSFKIRPVLGLIDVVAQDDPVLFKPFEGGAITHCVECSNIDFKRIRQSCSKSFGRAEYSNTATAQKTACMGLFELKGSSATDHIFFDNGRMYVYDASRDPAAIDHGTPVVMEDDDNMYSMIQYGDDIIWTDFAEHQPYHWANGDATFVEFQTTSAYKCRYLELFQQRVIMAHTTEINGDIEIRWSSRIPTAGSENYSASAQLYKETNEPITGIRTMGNNRCFLYDDKAISSIDYYPDYSTPFGLTTLVTNGGGAGHHSIIATGGRHFLFSSQYGFCEYHGNTQFPANGAPISDPIESIIATINQNYYGSIVGTFLPQTNSLAWTVPLYGVADPSHILIYDLLTKNWTIENKQARYIDNWFVTSNLIWNNLAGLGYTTWEDFGNLEWGELISSAQQLVLGNTDGKLYYSTGDSDDGADYEGYRIEPVINFGQTGRRALLLEIWFSIVSGGDFKINLWHRSGDTVYETINGGWTELSGIDCNNPNNAVAYLSETNRFHQIKWGTGKQNERFGVNEIVFKYVPQGQY